MFPKFVLLFTCLAILLASFWLYRSTSPSPRSVSYEDCALSERERILITGAAGFIGFHAAIAFQNEGFLVIGVDDFNEYYPPSLKHARAAELGALDIPVIKADINDQAVLRPLFDRCRFNFVVHLAAQAGVRYAARNPYSYVDSNVAGTVRLLEVVRCANPVPLFLYASSSSVYGNTKMVPFSEADRADSPVSLYAATKRSQELITASYVSVYNLRAIGLRFFTVYGPFGRPDMSIMSFSSRIVADKPIRVFIQPNGNVLARDFTYITDIVSGVVGAAQFSRQIAPGTHKLFNLGNSHAVSVLDMIHFLERYLNKSAKVDRVRLPALGDVIHTNADISEAREAFGYRPSVGIDEGIGLFVRWFNKFQRSHVFGDILSYVPD